MPEISRIKDKFYIVATSSLIDPRRFILKDDDTFGVFDRFGDILPLGKKDQGLYCGGTRFLSLYELKIEGERPFFLSSNIDEENILLTVDLTNPDIYAKDRIRIIRDSIHIMRSKFLCGKGCFEHLRIRNFGQEEITFNLELDVDSDFKDIFEVRGIKRKKRGKPLGHEYGDGALRIAYEGLDGVKRTTSVKFTRAPDSVREKSALFTIGLKPGRQEDLFFTVDCVMGVGDAGGPHAGFDRAFSMAMKKSAERNRNCADIHTANQQFNRSMKRSVSDINMMLTGTGHGLYPYGGIPWFCTPFGRDGIITALECLWMKPELAKGVLGFLSSLQAGDFDRAKAAEPGKILHEARQGEMAALNEIPFGLYYGSVDSTPLFIILAGAYWKRTGDSALIRRLWNSIENAIYWMDNYGDADGDGFLEYAPDIKGLRNQGWKDSQDSIFHRDGTLAEGPIALCEVQGYLYAAKREAAVLSGLAGKDEFAKRLLKEASGLKQKFNKAFWDDELGTYVIALDGEKKPCRVRASNAGHTLFTGIADEDKAKKVARTLTSDSVFSGWGIRTIADNEALYNPMSYHNGSVWPHDNALSALGLAYYGLKDEFIKVFSGIFEASLSMEFQRLPELFCGFHKRKGVAPTLYPVACTPQTWASGALLLMLQASLGIFFEAGEKRLIFKESVLPDFLNNIYIKNLMVTPKRSVDILVRRYGENVTIEAIRKPDDVSILIIK